MKRLFPVLDEDGLLGVDVVNDVVKGWPTSNPLLNVALVEEDVVMSRIEPNEAKARGWTQVAALTSSTGGAHPLLDIIKEQVHAGANKEYACGWDLLETFLRDGLVDLAVFAPKTTSAGSREYWSSSGYATWE
jgi:hypothetical protein